MLQTCEKPVEKPKKGRKRKTRTSLNAAGTFGFEPVEAEIEEEVTDYTKKENYLKALGLVSKNESEGKDDDEVSLKELPPYMPAHEPTLTAGPGTHNHFRPGDFIETVGCTGQSEIKPKKEVEEKPVTPKPAKRPARVNRPPRNTTPQVKEEPRDVKDFTPPTPSKKIKKEMIQEGSYHCKLCADSFFTENDLNNHEKTKHVKIQTYQCKICNYCSLEKSLMIRHMRTHSGQRPFYCKECGYAFTTKANCERHIRKRHNKAEKSEIDDLIRCDQNQLKTVSEDSWKYEIATVCMHCEEKFPDFWSLRDHLKIHDKRSFYCSDCNAAFSCRSNCIAHIMQKHDVTDREEANEKVKYEPGGGAKTKRKKVSEEPATETESSEPPSSETPSKENETTDVAQDTFTCRLCQKGFEAFIPYLNHVDDVHYKTFVRDTLKIKDENSYDFEKLFSAAQRAKDVYSTTKLSSLSRWDIRNYMYNRRATRMYKARMIPFKRLNDIRNRKVEASRQQQQQQQRGSVLAKLEYENEKPAQQSYTPRIQTIKRNPVIVREGAPHHPPYQPSTSTSTGANHSQGTTVMPGRYVTSKPVSSVHQKIVSSGKSNIFVL